MVSEENKNMQTEKQPAEDISELKRIRIEKLNALQQAGKDPFQVTTAEQSDRKSVV